MPDESIDAKALRLHAFYRGKVQTVPKVPVRGMTDIAAWYTPGVAAASTAIHRDPARSFDLTNRGNTVAIVTDGTRVLGLGDIGPEAALPVMEGKALLFKVLGGVDAVPICLATKDAAEIVRIVEALAPAFGGVNLEDIEQPKCFEVLDRLRERLTIPVWHDDQQGTAVVVLAALVNALAVVGKDVRHARIVLVGVGAANVAVYRLLRAHGVPAENVIACDSKGTLHRDRADVAERRNRFVDRWRLCEETNVGGLKGGIAEALAGADVCIAFSQSRPGVIDAAGVRAMARDPIVFACANPLPEIWPADAVAAGARIVATGRSDFANQVNNSLAFPGLFRGAFDVGARRISDGMAMAASLALAEFAREGGLAADRIVPRLDDPEVAPRVAVAVGLAAQGEGLARTASEAGALDRAARERIAAARASLDALVRDGVIREA